MNEFGIDSLQYSAGQQIRQAEVDQIEYIILKSGVSSAGYQQMTTPAYFQQTMTTYPFFESTIRLMKQNNKPTGAYFFSFAWDRTSAEYEANLMCDSLDVLTDKPDFPIFLDWEKTGYDDYRRGAYEGCLYHSITPNAALVQAVTLGWKSVVESRGYRAGLYTSGSLASTLFGSSFIQQQRQAGLYYWESSWDISQPFMPCDVWQYKGDTLWNGVIVDFDRIMDDRIWSGSSRIPIWLMLKIAERQRGDKHGCTIFL